jgi:hypothetical protein
MRTIISGVPFTDNFFSFIRRAAGQFDFVFDPARTEGGDSVLPTKTTAPQYGRCKYGRMIVAHSLFSRRVDQVPVKFSLKSTSEQTVQRAKMMPFKIKGDDTAASSRN